MVVVLGPGPKVIKKFILNLAEHEILNDRTYKSIGKFSILAASDMHRMLFFYFFKLLKCQQLEKI